MVLYLMRALFFRMLAVAVAAVHLQVLLHGLAARIPHHVTEGGLWNIEALHAVVVIDRQAHPDELSIHQYAGDGGHDTLLSESCNESIKVGALP